MIHGMDPEQIEFRLSLVTAQLAAIERAPEVTELMLSAPDLPAAMAAVAELLGLDEVASRAVVDTSWWRLTATERERLADEADRLRGQLPTGGVGAEH
jgi:DNA gyrase/topoisomerase IV subunit A